MEQTEHLDYRALAEFRYQIRRFLHFSETASRAAGLEPKQHQLLLTIKGLPPDVRPTVRTLAERMQLQHHSAVELIDRLERSGLAARHRGDEDRREVLVQLLPKGERLLRALSLHHQNELQNSGPNLAQTLQRLIARRPTRATENDRTHSIRNPKVRGL
jgi:DNA-binding MarR family transcriptional regulator